MVATSASSPIETYIRRNKTGILFTVSQAAAQIGRSTSTVKRWRKLGLFIPTESIQHGQKMVFLYTEDDITRLARFAKTVKRGRKAKDVS